MNKLWIYDSSCWPFEAYDMAFKTAASPLQRLAAQINISMTFICLKIAGVLHCFDKQLNYVCGQRTPKKSWIPDFPFVMILKLNHTINYFHTFLSCALLVTVSLVCCYCFLQHIYLFASFLNCVFFYKSGCSFNDSVVVIYRMHIRVVSLTFCFRCDDIRPVHVCMYLSSERVFYRVYFDDL